MSSGQSHSATAGRSGIFHAEVDLSQENSSWSQMAFLIGTSPARVLDVGCACGDFGLALKKRHSPVTLVGLELDANSAKQAEATGAYEQVLVCDLNDLPATSLPDFLCAFDVVVCGDVLEHLCHPLEVLKTLRRFLRDDGILVASVLNVAHMWVKSNLLTNVFRYTPTGLLDETHIHLFTYRSLAELLTDAGFKIETCRFTFSDRNAWYDSQAYEKLSACQLREMFSDWHSYVCQYVIRAHIGQAADGKDWLAENLSRLDLSAANAPTCISDCRTQCLSELPQPEEFYLREENKRLQSVNELLQGQLGEIVGSEWYRLCSKIKRALLFAFPKCSLRQDLLKRVYYFSVRIYKRFRHPYEYRQSKRAARSLSVMERAPKLKRFKPLKLPTCEEPIVSIVIPAYNQFAYTYCCVESIIRNSGSVPYEVILADDCSTDETRGAENILCGVRIARTERNFRFLLNCNNAARAARGRYILFLNNDTEVHENWLQPLVDLCERDGKIGVTGSKLVYADGVLQEAGGILWSDGSASNYGHGKDPNDFEYCYVKECDYISGAALMIRKSLWDEIGGFDERFAPAYYEDTDLCFEARKHGYKVVLQPQSIVTHFEGRSNGTDLSVGLKKYQVENQKKFYLKWKDVLAHHFPNGVSVFTARDRSAGKKHIFLVDHYIPTYDKDAGGRQIYFYLKTLQEMGFQVHLLGDNCMHDEPYTSTFQRMGIEVLYGGRMYPQNREAWFRENGKYIDFAFLHRPHIAVNYLLLVRATTKAKVIFFGADVGQVRVAREYEISHDPALKAELDAVTKQEDFLYGGADVNLCVGSGDADFVAKRYPGKPVFNIPLFIYDKFRESAPGFSERRDILFVGGFRHKPNVDGVLWFLREIFPRIKRNCPDMRFHVVGSEVPPSIVRLASDDVIVEGFLPDERLWALYDECRLTVAPLRFGAGVKGKIVDAMYFRSVVVTTTIGAEGIPQTPPPFAIADTAEDFARAVVRLYTDEAEWKKYQQDSLVVVKDTYSLERTQELLSRIFS